MTQCYLIQFLILYHKKEVTNSFISHLFMVER